MSEDTKSIEISREKRSGGVAEPAHGFEPFESLRQEIDRLFDSHLFNGFSKRGWRLPFSRPAGEFTWPQALEWGTSPAVDIVEKDSAYELSAELPGLGRENIDIQISGDTLTLKGEKKEEREEKTKNRYLSERRYGSFERMFQIPPGVDREKIDASFNKGVLKIVLPKTPEAQRATHKVEVKEH